VQQFVPEAVDGWLLALDESVTAPDRFLDGWARSEPHRQMHNVLASTLAIPPSPGGTSQEALSLLTATIDET